jgi:hypothetical protein
MERYSIGREDLRPIANRSNRMTWVYWERLLAEFDIRLIRFGGRASASLGSDARILIGLAPGQWQVEQTSPTGWKIVVQDFGLESLRAYLVKYGPELTHWGVKNRRSASWAERDGLRGSPGHETLGAFAQK